MLDGQVERAKTTLTRQVTAYYGENIPNTARLLSMAQLIQDEDNPMKNDQLSLIEI